VPSRQSRLPSHSTPQEMHWEPRGTPSGHQEKKKNTKNNRGITQRDKKGTVMGQRRDQRWRSKQTERCWGTTKGPEKGTHHPRMLCWY